MSEQEITQWTPIEIDAAVERKFEEIMPPGRSLACLHVDRETGTLRITLDDGREVLVPSRRN